MKKTNFGSVRILCCILALLLGVLCLPLSVFATGESVGTQPIGAQPDLPEGSDPPEPTFRETIRSDEKPELREMFCKQFDLGNNQTLAVVYSEAILYDEGGQWLEIDNSLSPDEKTHTYISASAGFSTSFSEAFHPEALVSIRDGKQPLSWAIGFLGEDGMMLPTENAAAVIRNGDAFPEDPASLGKAISEITYPDVVKGQIDLHYSIVRGKVEEDLLLTAPGAFRAYRLTLEAEGLHAHPEDDQSVTLRDENGEILYTVAAPWMRDANGVLSDAIRVEVQEADGEITVTVTPDREWLCDPERAYPVLIDPSFRTARYQSNYIDTYVLQSGEPAASIRASATSAPVGTGAYAYIKILRIPNSISYQSADEILFRCYGETSGGGTANTLGVRAVTTQWNLSLNEVLYGTGSIEGIKVSLERWLQSEFGNRWEEVHSSNGGLDVSLELNQWLVAFRLASYACYIYNSQTGTFDLAMVIDYHFWYRTNTGAWADKHGSNGSGSEHLGSDLPTDDDSDGWLIEEIGVYYSSDIIYYVLTE